MTRRGGSQTTQHAKARVVESLPAALDFGDAWVYAPALEASDSVPIAPRHELYIGGKWRAPKSARYYQTISPSTEETLSLVAEAGVADVADAIESARRAYDKYWRPMRPVERAKLLFRVSRAIQERARELAILESMNGGKPIKESRDVDVPLAAAHFFYHAGWADKLDYAFHGRVPRPLGVAAQIVPWNFPLLLAAWKIAPALACGNTVVLKPAETTPLTALLLARILEEADVPPGVVNVVTGGGETGAALASHAGVDHISFTGSTAVGRRLQKTLGGTKRLTLELGGKAANIVFADAAIDQAVEGIVSGIYFNQGQVCCAGSRLLVEESVHDLVVRKLKDRMSTLRLGDPLDKNTDIGAIHSKKQLGTIRDLVLAGERDGGERYSLACPLPKKGFWFPPTFFTGVAPSSRIAREEIFGPVLSILTFRTPEEAIEKANNTMYGLSAGIWTDKGAKVFWMAKRLRAGVVWANTYNKFDPSAPFGGYRESGFGREGGRQGLSEYVELG
jgi:aldehyde dehydrogenase (NAD+)